LFRSVRLAEDVDWVAGLQPMSGERRIGVKREIENREHADPVKCPDRDTLHQITMIPSRDRYDMPHNHNDSGRAA